MAIHKTKQDNGGTQDLIPLLELGHIPRRVLNARKSFIANTSNCFVPVLAGQHHKREYYELNANQDSAHGVVKHSPIVKIAKYLAAVHSDVPTTSAIQREAGLGRRTAIGLVESTRCLRAMSGLTCLEKVFFSNTASSWKKNLAESCSKLKTSITSTVSETITVLKTLNYGKSLSQEAFATLKRTIALLAPALELKTNP